MVVEKLSLTTNYYLGATKLWADTKPILIRSPAPPSLILWLTCLQLFTKFLIAVIHQILDWSYSQNSVLQLCTRFWIGSGYSTKMPDVWNSDFTLFTKVWCIKICFLPFWVIHEIPMYKSLRPLSGQSQSCGVLQEDGVFSIHPNGNVKMMNILLDTLRERFFRYRVLL